MAMAAGKRIANDSVIPLIVDTPGANKPLFFLNISRKASVFSAISPLNTPLEHPTCLYIGFQYISNLYKEAKAIYLLWKKR